MSGYADILDRLDPGLGLSEEILSRRCASDHIGFITNNFNWRRVAPFLRLSPQDVEDIQVDSHCEPERRVHALRLWMQQQSHMATYGGLIRALLDSKLREQALNVAVILMKSSRNSDSSSENYQTPPQSPPTKSRHTQTDPQDITCSSNTIAVSHTERRIHSLTSQPNGRVSNDYEFLHNNIPRAKINEQSVKTYLSTRDFGTQTPSFPQAPSKELYRDYREVNPEQGVRTVVLTSSYNRIYFLIPLFLLVLGVLMFMLAFLIIINK